MAAIILATINARYPHASLGLRWLRANLGQLREQSEIREHLLTERPVDIAESLLAASPRIVGLGVYVWNATACLELARLLKLLRPSLYLVVGGPEASYEIEHQEITQIADFVIAGEADHAFRDLCARLLAGTPPRDKAVRATPPDLATLASPYDLYSDHDLAHRITYVEASRGCPFGCELCLSSLTRTVRPAPLDRFVADLDRLLDRGARHIKLVDRTFNLEPSRSQAILAHLAERAAPGRFFHVEMVPSNLPDGVRAALTRFPAGSLQIEVGVQTFDPEVAAAIGRRQSPDEAASCLSFLRGHTCAHIHADLVAGLPGESLAGFALGFDRLVALSPHEIQVGILKRLRGAPIARHDRERAMVYSPSPPYELLQNDLISFAQLQDLKRFARAWDLIGNSGNFRESKRLLWADESPFAGLTAFTHWLTTRVSSLCGVALDRLTRLFFDYLVDVCGQDPAKVAPILAEDYARPGRRVPTFLAELAPAAATAARARLRGMPRRQARHLAD